MAKTDKAPKDDDLKLARLISMASLAALLAAGVFAYGRASTIHNWFPNPLVEAASAAVRELKDKLAGTPPNYLIRMAAGPKVTRPAGGPISPGLNMISSISPELVPTVSLVDADGQTVHRWVLDWFKIWPEASHLPESVRPKERPGSEIEGFVLSPNGDLTFSYENLGMLQVDVCGAVKWRTPKLTHHSIVQDESGNFWAPAFKMHETPDKAFPNHGPRFREFTLIEVSPEGRQMREISVNKLLQQNGLAGMLYLSTRDTYSTTVSGDTLHLNDIDVAPSTMTEGVAKPGDLMVSLRNANAIVIFDPDSLKIRTVVRDRFVRQHDPDFGPDGDHITVFDNNNITETTTDQSSRLLRIDLNTTEATRLFEGNRQHPFFSRHMGRAQALPNGDQLLVEAARGRMIEISPGGEVVWQYRNYVAPDLVSQLFDGMRVSPETMTTSKIKQLALRCHA